MEWIKSLSPRDKVLVLGGGALILLLLIRAISGNKTSTDAGVLGDQSQATAQAEQKFEADVTQAMAANTQQTQDALAAQAKAMQDTTQGLLQMMSGFQETQQKNFTDLEQTLTTATTNQNSQISNLLSQMSRPVQYSTPAPAAPSQPSTPAVKTVYGNSIDLANAKDILGSSGYRFVNTEGLDTSRLPLNSSSIVVGGTGAGVGDVPLNGAVRLAGYDRDQTKQAILQYAVN